MPGTVRTSRARHLRHRRLDGITRGTEGAKDTPRLKRFAAWLAARADDASEGGIGDTAVTDAFTTNLALATGILTATGQPTDADTITIGSRVYTFVDPFVNVADNVFIDASVSITLDNLKDAIINGVGEGSAYGTGTVEHADVSADAGAGDTLDFEAKVAGAAGNSIATDATDTDNSSFATATLEGGIDGDAFNAVAHGLTTADGPFVLTTTDTLPDGLALLTLYWVQRVDDDNLKVYLSKEAAARDENAIFVTDDGTGTQTFARAADIPGLIEWLRQDNDPDTIQALTDIDDL